MHDRTGRVADHESLTEAKWTEASLASLLGCWWSSSWWLWYCGWP